jgi:hypothetical protein
MKILRNIFAVLGIVLFLLTVFFGVRFYESIKSFDENAGTVYSHIASELLKTNDISETLSWKIPVAEGLTPDDVEQIMLAVASEHNIAFTGVFNLGEDIQLKTEKPYRFVKIYTFCRSRLAAQMMDYNDAYVSFMPCRIALVENRSGEFWLYSMNMDPMIYGGTELPSELKSKAIEIRNIMFEIMNKGASGEF